MSTRKPEPMLVRDVMLPPDRFPVIGEKIILKEALEEMGRSRLGIACIVDLRRKLLGIVTDGDIRRKLLKVQKPLSALFVDDALDHAIRSPITTRPDVTLLDAVRQMGERQVWDLPVVDGDGFLVGLLHLHPAVQALLRASQS
jgi:DeoR family transcriptional regulator, catabolite repression regulator